MKKVFIIIGIALFLTLGFVIFKPYYRSQASSTPKQQPQPSPTPAGQPQATLTPEKPTQPFAYPAGLMGYAISWAQCGAKYPKLPYDFGVLDVTGGRSLTHNRCLKSEFEWASKAAYPPTFYINLTYPTVLYRKGLGPHEYGYETARDAYEYAVSQEAESPLWWLDVQTKSTWSDDTTINQAVAQGAIDFFKEKELSTGLSTTPYQWKKIMGDFNTDLPNWIPGIPGKAKALKYCKSGKGYSGGTVQQLADILPKFETVYTCGDIDTVGK